MNKEVFNQEYILFDTSARTQEKAFVVIAQFTHYLGFADNETEYFEGLKQR